MRKFLLLSLVLIALSSVYTTNALECMESFCHQTTFGSYPAINASLFGSHININTTNGAGNLSSSDCSACHYDTSKMFIPGFTVATRNCEYCHMNASMPSVPQVYNHTRNAGISVNSFCSDCHIKNVNLSIYSSNASVAHYGRNASFGLPAGEQYCIYCHQNASTNYFDVMSDPNNNKINNHTSGIINPGHPAGRPYCTSCHGQDNLHGTNIIKPVINPAFCNNCHNSDTLNKNSHAGNVECIRCHAEASTDIHNIKYVMPDGSFGRINATACIDCHNFLLPAPFIQLPFSAADCTTCHQGGLSAFGLAPKIPAPVEHSTNAYSGGMWKGSQPSYWSNTSQKAACYYCHGNSIHAANALGNVTNIQSGNLPDQSITTTSFWCANCHYMGTASGNYSYNAVSYYPVPPEIQNKTGIVPGNATDSTNFFNHSLSEWSDSACRTCHSINSPNTTAVFVHNVAAGGGGADCISCHNVSATGAPPDKRIDIIQFNKSVHYGLNGGGSRSCWACHGDGTEPSGHPAGYKSPRICSSDNCHSLQQDYRAPMVYSHFTNASRNGNPENARNENVTAGSSCEVCHARSASASGSSIYSTASHYSSRDLPETINCIYCHLNKNNSEDWGNATLIYENRTNLAELDRGQNKFIVKAGESFDLGNSFRLNVLEISRVRDSALIELVRDNVLMDRSVVKTGNYTYEENLTIDDEVIKTPVIVLNITAIFSSANSSFIQFEGYRLKRIHSEKKTTSCYMCHVYTISKRKYIVLDREKGDPDTLFYTEVLVDSTGGRDYDETEALGILENITDTDRLTGIGSWKRKSLFEGETWNIAEDYSIMFRDITTNSDEAYLMLRIGNDSYYDFVRTGETFEYSPALNFDDRLENVTIFRAKVVEMIQAKPNMVVLEDAYALSPDIRKITANRTLHGYNASWLWENSTITVGKIPENFHSPQLFDGKDGGGDCLSCHGGLVEKSVSSLGRHEKINGGGNNACYACHGGSKESKVHPPGYRSPRNCISCHAQREDNYGAVYIGDEEHKKEKCQVCHISNTHKVTVYNILPSVNNPSLQKQGSATILKATAQAGYKMKVRGARYYMDTPDEKILMQPIDGTFDSQSEEIFAEIDVSKISQSRHIIYIESMERDNKWSTPVSLPVKLENGELRVDNVKRQDADILVVTAGILAIAFLLMKIMGVNVSGYFRNIIYNRHS